LISIKITNQTKNDMNTCDSSGVKGKNIFEQKILIGANVKVFQKQNIFQLMNSIKNQQIKPKIRSLPIIP
jgi:hypothetical protein